MFAGLIISLDPEGEIAALRALDGVEVGPAQGHLWPVVVEAQDRHQLEQRFEAVREAPGVATVDLVQFDFSSHHEEHSA